MKGKSLAVICAVVVLITACWASYTKLQSVAIQNSIINSTTIGATTPSSVVFTTAKGSAYTGNKNLYTDGSGFVTEGGPANMATGTWDYATGAGCTTPENDVCSTDLTFVNGGFSDASYIPVCTGGDATNGHIIINSVTRLSATQIRVYSVNYSTDTGLNFAHLYCHAYHP